ncbi:MAG: response regulator [Gemmatimonadaceae bacterium]|nr:response regulator [Gemmatimonadaceae bacterium]
MCASSQEHMGEDVADLNESRDAAWRACLHDLRNHLMPMQLRLDVARRLVGADTANGASPSLGSVLESMNGTMRDIGAVVRAMEELLGDTANQRPSAIAESETPNRPVAENPSALRLLIVDDNATMADALSELVLAQGRFSIVHHAAAAAEARTMLASESFDLILLDVHLADGDGIALCKELMALNPSRRIALMSGRVDAALSEEAHASGALGFIAKGADMHNLPDRLVALATGRPKPAP